jgi:hypothetical protein
LALRAGSMALCLAIISVVVGIALGVRFKVLVLVPAIALATIFVGLVGFAPIGLSMVIASVSIQLGYFVGIFLAKRFQ